MNRTWMLYAAMLGALFGGTWIVLRIGAGLRAPRDISGRWIVVDEPGGEIEVRQSGRFVRLRMDERDELALRWHDSAGSEGHELGQLVGDGVAMTLRALSTDSDAHEPGHEEARHERLPPTHVLESQGALSGTWRLRRAGPRRRAVEGS